MISKNDSEEYERILTRISEICIRNNSSGQAAVLDNAVNNLKSLNIEDFIQVINSVDMWGGSGSVIDLLITDKEDAAIFESEFFQLTNLMKENDILGKQAKSRRKLLH